MASNPIDLNNCTLMEACYATTGDHRQASRLYTFVAEWNFTHKRIGREPSEREYRQIWGVSRSATAATMALFRQVFPKCETPSELPSAQKRAELGRDFCEITGARLVT